MNNGDREIEQLFLLRGNCFLISPPTGLGNAGYPSSPLDNIERLRSSSTQELKPTASPQISSNAMVVI